MYQNYSLALNRKWCHNKTCLEFLVALWHYRPIGNHLFSPAAWSPKSLNGNSVVGKGGRPLERGHDQDRLCHFGILSADKCRDHCSLCIDCRSVLGSNPEGIRTGCGQVADRLRIYKIGFRVLSASCPHLVRALVDVRFYKELVWVICVQ